jgi:hypothetical protein
LSKSDLATLRRSLEAIATGDFVSKEEFETVIGASISEIEELVTRWPQLTASGTIDSKFARRLVGSVLNNLTRFPHGKFEQLVEYTGATREDLLDLLERV